MRIVAVARIGDVRLCSARGRVPDGHTCHRAPAQPDRLQAVRTRTCGSGVAAHQDDLVY